jgi:hypothetical protein
VEGAWVVSLVEELRAMMIDPKFRHRDKRTNSDVAEDAADRIEALERALAGARDDMYGWMGYAGEYFQWKHDAAADIDTITVLLGDEYEHDLPGEDWKAS